MDAMTRVVEGDLPGTVESAASGDEAAFGRLVAAHNDDMRRVSRFITRDDALADATTQAAWAIAWRKLGSLREPVAGKLGGPPDENGAATQPEAGPIHLFAIPLASAG
jgi:hypothetical protein